MASLSGCINCRTYVGTLLNAAGLCPACVELIELAKEAAQRMKDNPATEEEAIEAMTNFIMDTRLGGP